MTSEGLVLWAIASYLFAALLFWEVWAFSNRRWPFHHDEEVRQ